MRCGKDLLDACRWTKKSRVAVGGRRRGTITCCVAGKVVFREVA
jgi:hypothetical protein